jgi:hypothetical protein
MLQQVSAEDGQRLRIAFRSEMMIDALAILIYFLPLSEVGYQFLCSAILKLTEGAHKGLVVSLCELGQLVARERALVTISRSDDSAELILNQSVVTFILCNQIHVLFPEFRFDGIDVGLDTDGHVEPAAGLGELV